MIVSHVQSRVQLIFERDQVARGTPLRLQLSDTCLSQVLSAPTLKPIIKMSATSTPTDSPASAPIQPMHNPSQAAHIVVPQAPLGHVANGANNAIPGMGMKALLAKKLAKSKCVHERVDQWQMLTLFTRSFQQSQVCLADRQPDDTRHTEAECCEAETLH